MSAFKTNVPKAQFTDAGLEIPEEGDILEGVIQDHSVAFDNTIDYRDSKTNVFLQATPQGQLVASIAAIISDSYNSLAYYVNQVNPDFATGRMQDAIGKIYFMDRIPAQATVVNATCYGMTGTIIPKGTLVKDTSGNIYESTEQATINDTGSINVDFQCTTTGPVECKKNTLTQLYQIIQGFERINNPTDGIVGRNVESSEQFEARRRKSVAINAVNSVDSIMSSLLSLENVIDAYVTDNSAAHDALILGVSLKPHSIFVCVAGGKPEEIARAIWRKKPPGCDMNGDTTITIVDDSGLYGSTPPQYKITYQKAKPVRLLMSVTLIRPQSLPIDAKKQIKDAVLNAFNGVDGSVKAGIGSLIKASSFYHPIQRLGSWAQIINLYIGENAANETLVQINIDQIPTLNADDIEVTFSG